MLLHQRYYIASIKRPLKRYCHEQPKKTLLFVPGEHDKKKLINSSVRVVKAVNEKEKKQFRGM